MGKLLLENGANINAKDGIFSGLTLLHYAAKKGYRDATKMLLENGANINATDGIVFDRTPLNYAESKAVKELLLGQSME